MLKRIGPPIVAFALARWLLWWAAKRTKTDAFTAEAWSRWDSAHYLSIAEKGYEFFSCAKLPGYDPKLWCGNAAWMPGYPWLIKLVSMFGVQLVTAGAVLSAIWALLTLILLWNGFLEAELKLINLLTLALAAFFPGHVYDHAVFPVSQFAFFELLALWFYVQRHYAWAGLAGAAAAFTYSSGLFLAGAIGVHILISERRKPYLEVLRQLVLVSGGVALGFLAVLTVQRIQTGAWNAYFMVQGKYAYAFRTPFTAWYEHLYHVTQSFPSIGGQSDQTLFVAGLCTLSIAFLPWRKGLERVDGVLVCVMLVYWLIPLMLGGQLSIYRAEATLLPTVPLVRRMPWPVASVMVGIAYVLARVMAKLFFRSVLV